MSNPKKEASLFKAAQKGNLKKVKKLLKKVSLRPKTSTNLEGGL